MKREVSIRAPAGERPAELDKAAVTSLFRSALPRGSDAPRNAAFYRRTVSIRAPARERHSMSRWFHALQNVSIRAPARERPQTIKVSSMTNKGFDPRSREGATCWRQCAAGVGEVSIRAPAQGATANSARVMPLAEFRSALPRGSDRRSRVPRCRSLCFDPRSREGATPRLVPLAEAVRVSIRAPARERLAAEAYAEHYGEFRSALPRGSDLRCRRDDGAQYRFRSALPRGSDYRCADRRLVDGVSIRAPARERPQPAPLALGREVFRSALPRGSDVRPGRYVSGRARVSIRAPARERPRDLGPFPLSRPFRSALPRGSDVRSTDLIDRGYGFDPRSREGATGSVMRAPSIPTVSIRAPARERRSAAR